jgi:hypothetical protein
MDGLIRARQAKILQLQAQQLQLQNQQMIQNQRAAAQAKGPAVQSGEIMTDGYLNGRAWANFSPDERAVYVRAVIEGMVVLGTVSNSMPKVSERTPENMTVARVCECLDIFYQSTETRVVRLVDAISAVAEVARRSSSNPK